MFGCFSSISTTCKLPRKQAKANGDVCAQWMEEDEHSIMAVMAVRTSREPEFPVQHLFTSTVG